MSLIDVGLDQTGYVYTPNDSDGDFSELAETALPCRVVRQGAGALDARRAEQTNDALLLWGPDYVMSERAQIFADGEFWNVDAGTFAAIRGLGSAVEYRKCGVRRATGTRRWLLGVDGASELGVTTYL